MASTWRRRALLGSNPKQQVGRAMRRLICSSSTSAATSIGSAPAGGWRPRLGGHRGIDDDAVWARNRVDQAGQLAGGLEAVDATCRILEAGLPLIGEVQIAVEPERQIVDA